MTLPVDTICRSRLEQHQHGLVVRGIKITELCWMSRQIEPILSGDLGDGVPSSMHHLASSFSGICLHGSRRPPLAKPLRASFGMGVLVYGFNGVTDRVIQDQISFALNQ
jgi:hypothetical protein